MQQTVYLTSSQKSQMETSKQLYVFLRMINFVQKYYSYDKIDANTYKTQISKLIEKYNRFTQIIPNYSLEEFIKNYHIPQEQVSWAKLVLQKGINSQENQGKQTFLYMQAVAKFIQVIQTLQIQSDDPQIQSLKIPLEELQLILKKLYKKLGSQFSQKFTEYQRQLKDYVNSKSFSQSLIQSQLNEIKHTVEAMYRMMQLIMKS